MKLKGREIDWRFWLAAPVVVIVPCAGLTLFHRCTELGRSLSVDGLAMVGTTLFAAATGFLAVVFQVRSAARQLREQLADQHQESAAESERQKKAVATAILFEIDDFYRYHVGRLRGYLEEKAGKRELLEVVRIPQSMFAVYRGNTPRLGELPDEVVEAVVHFYSKAEQFFALREEYRAARERHGGPVSQLDSLKVWTLVGHIRDFLPGLTGAAHIACERLCGFTGVEFKSPRIAVAGEDIAALNRETERIEHEEVHRI